MRRNPRDCDPAREPEILWIKSGARPQSTCLPFRGGMRRRMWQRGGRRPAANAIGEEGGEYAVEIPRMTAADDETGFFRGDN